MVDKRLEAAKLEALAEFAAGAGHEINNPIAVIAGRAQLLLEQETNSQRRHELAIIHAQAMRVYEMIADMMLFARPPAPKLADCDCAPLVASVVAELSEKAAKRDVELKFDNLCELSTVRADAAQLAVAVRAICDNGLNAVDRNGKIEIRIEKRFESDAAAIAIMISDNGPGIAVDAREHLFDPFFSGRQAGRGLGMGLAKAWRIVTNHRGRIEVQSAAGAGTVFTIILPAG